MLDTKNIEKILSEADRASKIKLIFLLKLKIQLFPEQVFQHPLHLVLNEKFKGNKNGVFL